MFQRERRLAAIMFTDMVGYTAIAQKNESLSLALVDEERNLVRPIFGAHNGREIKTMGDAHMVEFSSTVDAVESALEIQSALKAANDKRPEERRIVVRIGIHLGDVVHAADDIMGDAVNVASRIEGLAPPGGICVSGQVKGSVINKVRCRFETLGFPELKNVTEPIEVFWIPGYGETRPALQGGRIAILPFTNLSSDPNDEYLADGMTDELIYRLAQVRQLKVIARTSVMGYKKRDKKTSEIAWELGVSALVDGSVRKSGKRIRITVQLISARTEEYMWSSRYDKELDDIFAVQSEIAEKVAGELRVRLVESVKNNLEKKPTESTEAYADFLRGRELLREGTEPSFRRALALFQRAVQVDPTFARAHVGIADSHQWLGNYGYEPMGETLPVVKASLERALELDPDLAEAHASLARMLFNEDDGPGSRAEARRALELNPSLPDPHYNLSELAYVEGDLEGGVKEIEEAYRLDPIRPLFIQLVGRAYLWAGRDEEALEHLKKTEHLAPAGTYRVMSEYYLSKGDVGKAKEYHAKVERLETNPWNMYMGGMIAAYAGDREKALEAIGKLMNLGPDNLSETGYVYLTLGDLDSYFSFMDRAIEARVLIPSVVMYSPLLAKAREDPRFQGLIKKQRRLTGLSG